MSLIDPALMASLGLEFDPKREARLEAVRKYKQTYYQEHKARHDAYTRQYKKDHPGYGKKAKKKYRARHRKAVRAGIRKAYERNRDGLTDSYVSGLLSTAHGKGAGGRPPRAAFPKELIDAKRAELLLKRKLQITKTETQRNP